MNATKDKIKEGVCICVFIYYGSIMQLSNVNFYVPVLFQDMPA